MALTRDKAIDLAVMRHVAAKVGGFNRAGQDTFLHLMERAIRERIWLWEQEVTAIRAHYRVICRTYGVLNNPTIADILKTPRSGRPEYDGHSLRI